MRKGDGRRATLEFSKLRVERLEDRRVLAPVISVGDHVLLADAPNQQVRLFVTGGDDVQGVDLFIQVADGGPEAPGGTIDGPAITQVDLFSGTIFAGNNTGEAGGSVVPQFWYSGTTTQSETVAADGLLATVTIDTSGFSASAPYQPFDLKLADTLMGDTWFPRFATDVTNGRLLLKEQPTAVIGALASMPEGGTLALSAAASHAWDPGDTIVAYEWDLDGDGIFAETGADAARGDEVGVSPTFSAAGLDGPSAWPVQLRVKDGNFAQNALFVSEVTTATVSIVNAAPTITASDLDRTVIEPGATMTLTGAFDDPAAQDTHTVMVDWGDGQSSQAVVDAQLRQFSADHRYDASGTYQATATLRDKDLGEVQASHTVSVAQDLGTVAWVRLEHLAPASLDLWYRFQTVRDGSLTLEATSATPADTAELALYDPADTASPLAVSSPFEGKERLDHGTVAGTTYFLKVSGDSTDVELRLANLVARSGSTVHVYGSDAIDQFLFDASAGIRVAVNGIGYQYAGGEVSSLFFDGAASKDVATLTCSAGDETAVLYPDRGTIKGPGYFVTLAGIEHKTVDAGGGAADVVKISGSNYGDTFTADPTEATVISPGYSTRAIGFDNLSTYARTGNDKATFAGSAAADTFVGRPTYSNLLGPGFYVGAQEFDEVTVRGTPGDGDAAYFTDSTGDETVVADPQQAAMTGAAFKYTATGFDTIFTNARNGGTDTANLADGPADDTFDAYPDYATLHGPGFWIQAKYFDEVKATGTAGGENTANFFDSPGDDTLDTSYAETKLITYRGDNYAYGFLVANAYGYNGGVDTAHVHGTAGSDTFKFYGNASPMYGRLTARIPGGAVYDRLVKAFDNVYAYGEGSGADVAWLYDTAGDDTFLGKPDESRLSGAGYLAVANAFDEVHAQASGGNDTAELNDSAFDDMLTAAVGSIQLASNNATLDYLYEVLAFDSVTATSTTGNDTKNIDPAVTNLTLLGAWQ